MLRGIRENFSDRTSKMERFLSWVSSLVLVFFRYKFGERTLYLVWVPLAWIFYWVFRLLIKPMSYLTSFDWSAGGLYSKWFDIYSNVSLMLHTHFILYTLLFFIHFLVVQYRKWISRKEWYSKSRGISVLYELLYDLTNGLVKLLSLNKTVKKNRVRGSFKFPIPQHFFWMYIEPLVLGMIAYYFIANLGLQPVSLFNNTIFNIPIELTTIPSYHGYLLLVCAICLFFREQLEYEKYRSRVLDIKDGMLETEYLTTALLKGRAKKKKEENKHGVNYYGAVHARENIMTERVVTIPNTSTQN